MGQWKDDSSMSSSIWVLAALAALVTVAIISQVTPTATCYRVPGCMTMKHYLGPGLTRHM